jgi:hypothetical protein
LDIDVEKAPEHTERSHLQTELVILQDTFLSKKGPPSSKEHQYHSTEELPSAQETVPLGVLNCVFIRNNSKVFIRLSFVYGPKQTKRFDLCQYLSNGFWPVKSSNNITPKL